VDGRERLAEDQHRDGELHRRVEVLEDADRREPEPADADREPQ
jgi:hypothetical protein